MAAELGGVGDPSAAKPPKHSETSHGPGGKSLGPEVPTGVPQLADAQDVPKALGPGKPEITPGPLARGMRVVRATQVTETPPSAEIATADTFSYPPFVAGDDGRLYPSVGYGRPGYDDVRVFVNPQGKFALVGVQEGEQKKRFEIIGPHQEVLGGVALSELIAFKDDALIGKDLAGGKFVSIKLTDGQVKASRGFDWFEHAPKWTLRDHTFPVASFETGISIDAVKAFMPSLPQHHNKKPEDFDLAFKDNYEALLSQGQTGTELQNSEVRLQMTEETFRYPKFKRNEYDYYFSEDGSGPGFERVEVALSHGGHLALIGIRERSDGTRYEVLGPDLEPIKPHRYSKLVNVGDDSIVGESFYDRGHYVRTMYEGSTVDAEEELSKRDGLTLRKYAPQEVSFFPLLHETLENGVSVHDMKKAVAGSEPDPSKLQLALWETHRDLLGYNDSSAARVEFPVGDLEGELAAIRVTFRNMYYPRAKLETLKLSQTLQADIPGSRPDYVGIKILADHETGYFGLVGIDQEGRQYLVHWQTYDPLTPGFDGVRSLGRHEIVVERDGKIYAVTTADKFSDQPFTKHGYFSGFALRKELEHFTGYDVLRLIGDKRKTDGGIFSGITMDWEYCDFSKIKAKVLGVSEREARSQEDLITYPAFYQGRNDKWYGSERSGIGFDTVQLVIDTENGKLAVVGMNETMRGTRFSILTPYQSVFGHEFGTMLAFEDTKVIGAFPNSDKIYRIPSYPWFGGENTRVPRGERPHADRLQAIDIPWDLLESGFSAQDLKALAAEATGRSIDSLSIAYGEKFSKLRTAGIIESQQSTVELTKGDNERPGEIVLTDDLEVGRYIWQSERQELRDQDIHKPQRGYSVAVDTQTNQVAFVEVVGYEETGSNPITNQGETHSRNELFVVHPLTGRRQTEIGLDQVLQIDGNRVVGLLGGEVVAFENGNFDVLDTFYDPAQTSVQMTDVTQNIVEGNFKGDKVKELITALGGSEDALFTFIDARRERALPEPETRTFAELSPQQRVSELTDILGAIHSLDLTQQDKLTAIHAVTFLLSKQDADVIEVLTDERLSDGAKATTRLTWNYLRQALHEWKAQPDVSHDSALPDMGAFEDGLWKIELLDMARKKNHAGSVTPELFDAVHNFRVGDVLRGLDTGAALFIRRGAARGVGSVKKVIQRIEENATRKATRK